MKITFYALIMTFIICLSGCYTDGQAHSDFRKAEELSQEGDIKQAFELYQRAAEHGDIDAQFALGGAYLVGDLGIKNDEKAIYWLKKAGEQGDHYSLLYIAIIYYEGMAFEGKKDVNQAFKWFIKAAEAGSLKAQLVLGSEYITGEDLGAKDPKQALHWYKKAAEQGDPEGLFNVGDIYFNGLLGKKNPEQALPWYEKAAERDNARALVALGRMYLDGVGVIQDSKHAIQWFSKAAEQDAPVAAHAIGIIYATGNGVPRNLYKASFWIKKAINGGFTKSRDAWNSLELWRYQA
ncbi:MAG: SEL1-like repeat protein [Oleispira sp.]